MDCYSLELRLQVARFAENASASGTLVYMRMNRRSKSGVLDRVFTELQRAQIVRIRIEAVSLDSTAVKVHPDGIGALKRKTDPKQLEDPEADGPQGFIRLPRMLERP